MITLIICVVITDASMRSQINNTHLTEYDNAEDNLAKDRVVSCALAAHTDGTVRLLGLVTVIAVLCVEGSKDAITDLWQLVSCFTNVIAELFYFK